MVWRLWCGSVELWRGEAMQSRCRPAASVLRSTPLSPGSPALQFAGGLHQQRHRGGVGRGLEEKTGGYFSHFPLPLALLPVALFPLRPLVLQGSPSLRGPCSHQTVLAREPWFLAWLWPLSC